MIRALLLTGIALASAAPAIAQHDLELPAQPPVLPPPPMAAQEGSDWVIYPVRDNVFMLSGPSGNVAVQTGRDGVVVVDTGTESEAQDLIRQIRRLSDKPIRYIFNTGSDVDHTGGNASVASGGVDLVGGTEGSGLLGNSGGSPILAHEQVMFQLLEDEIFDGLPTLTYFAEQKDVHFNGGPISLIHAPGHNAGNSLVMFRRADVVAAGDVYSPDRYPFIDIDRGGSITDYLASLNHLIAITVPEFNQQGGTMVIPGHGRLSDEGDIGEYRDMVTFIRDRVKTMMERGMSFEEIAAARPTFDYDPLFGPEAGDVFVDQIYRSLSQEGE